MRLTISHCIGLTNERRRGIEAACAGVTFTRLQQPVTCGQIRRPVRHMCLLQTPPVFQHYRARQTKCQCLPRTRRVVMANQSATLIQRRIGIAIAHSFDDLRLSRGGGLRD